VVSISRHDPVCGVLSGNTTHWALAAHDLHRALERAVLGDIVHYLMTLRMCCLASGKDAGESHRHQSHPDKLDSGSGTCPALVPPCKFRIVGSDKCHWRMESRRACRLHRSSLRIRCCRRADSIKSASSGELHCPRAYSDVTLENHPTMIGNLCVRVRVRVLVRVRVHMHMYICTYVHIYIYTHMRIYTYTHIHVYIYYVYAI
jgi:hypothetical protein